MACPNMHSHAYPRTLEGIQCFVSSYWRPLVAFCAMAGIGWGITVCLWSLLFVRSGPGPPPIGCVLWWHGVGVLVIADAALLLSLISFARAVGTAAGYVGPDPWAHPPQTDLIAQGEMQTQWVQQRKWLHEHSAVAVVRMDAIRPSPSSAPPLQTLPGQRPTGGVPNPYVVVELEADGSLRHCASCGLYKPDGAHHCRWCGRCTFLMDHHCPYLNNCVGAANYKYFCLTLSYGALCGLVALPAVCWFSVVTIQQGGPTTPYVALATAMGIAASLPVVVRLVWYHWRLIREGKTTLEQMRDAQIAQMMAALTKRSLRPLDTMGGGLAVGDAEGQCLARADIGEEENRRHQRDSARRLRFRRTFGRPRHWVYHLLPIAPQLDPVDYPQVPLQGSNKSAVVVLRLQ